MSETYSLKTSESVGRDRSETFQDQKRDRTVEADEEKSQKQNQRYQERDVEFEA